MGSMGRPLSPGTCLLLLLLAPLAAAASGESLKGAVRDGDGNTGGSPGPRTSPALLLPPDAEKTPGYWNEGARRRLEAALALQPAAQRAKNIILFVGDGECLGLGTRRTCALL